MMKKFLFILALVLIPFTLAEAGARDVTTMSTGLITATGVVRTGPGRLYAVHGNATTAAGVITLYDGDVSDSTDDTKIITRLKQPTDEANMQDSFNGLVYKKLYVVITTAEATFEIEEQ